MSSCRAAKQFFHAPFAVLAAIAMVSCASPGVPKKENVVSVHQLILKTVHYRRPAGPGADPRVGPGGEDFVSHPLPDAHLDCRRLVELHRDLDLKAARECLSSIREPQKVSYRLRRLAEPRLELIETESTPGCLKETLREIPVPRELVFQSFESGAPECYSARLDIESDELPGIGVKWPLSRTMLVLDFPLREVPADPAKFALLLDTWTLSLFLGAKDPVLRSHLMPEAICVACMGEETLIRPGSPPQPLWPEKENPMEILK